MEAEPRRQDTLPGPDEDRALHERLVRRDPTAPSDLAASYLEPLIRWLADRFRNLDAHLLESAAIDLLLDLAQRPEQFDPSRASLSSYLHMAARRDVQNAVRSEQRRAHRQVPLEAVELRPPAGNTLVEADPGDLIAEVGLIDRATLAELRSNFDDQEWEIVQLMSERERPTAIYAEILGLQDWPAPEQAREVKRVKDRLQKRLRRLAPKVRRDD